MQPQPPAPPHPVTQPLACPGSTEWLVVTNGDNDYDPSFMARVIEEGVGADAVAFDYYSRFQRPTGGSGVGVGVGVLWKMLARAVDCNAHHPRPRPNPRAGPHPPRHPVRPLCGRRGGAPLQAEPDALVPDGPGSHGVPLAAVCRQGGE